MGRDRVGTECGIYPTLHPHFRFPWTEASRSTIDSLRAAAHLDFRQGPHGLSTVNMFEAEQNLWLRELRDSEPVAAGPHHYRYTFDAHGSSAPSLKLDGLVWRCSPPIRIVDDPNRLAGKLAITIESLGDERWFDIILNDKVVPRPRQDGGRAYPVAVAEAANTFVIELPLPALDLRRGLNYLAFGYNQPVSSGTWLHVQEVELFVDSAAEGANAPTRKEE